MTMGRTERNGADDGTLAELEGQDQGVGHKAGDSGCNLLGELHVSWGRLFAGDAIEKRFNFSAHQFHGLGRQVARYALALAHLEKLRAQSSHMSPLPCHRQSEQ